jgi:hypothetical protein
MKEKEEENVLFFLLPAIFQNGSTAFHEVTKIKEFNSLSCAYLVSFWRHHHMKLSISVSTTIFICMREREKKVDIFLFTSDKLNRRFPAFSECEIIIFKYFFYIVMTINRGALKDALNKKR